METSLTPHQHEVLRAFYEFGHAMDDQTLAAFAHHIVEIPMSSSSIRSRRAELARAGFITVVDTKKLKSGRTAAVHGLTARGRKLAKRLPALVA